MRKIKNNLNLFILLILSFEIRMKQFLQTNIQKKLQIMETIQKF